MSKTKEQKPEYNNYLQEKIDKVRKVVKQGEEIFIRSSSKSDKYNRLSVMKYLVHFDRMNYAF